MHSVSLSQIVLPNNTLEFLHSGHKCWMLDFELWTLDPGRSQETFTAESIPSIAIGSRLDRPNWLKVTPKKTFFWKFAKTAVFSECPLKNA